MPLRKPGDARVTTLSTNNGLQEPAINPVSISTVNVGEKRPAANLPRQPDDHSRFEKAFLFILLLQVSHLFCSTLGLKQCAKLKYNTP